MQDFMYTFQLKNIFHAFSQKTDLCNIIDQPPQHDELESNLKKIPHRNGIWGLEAIVM